ncbi:MAG TPA: methyltransferase domain-containing protein [Woeseiaceae bacterium]|nr:methyltransferase domain-containing protein [Woeseiaceae bacterium]
MDNDNWTFLRAFLKSPRVVGSAIPSSSFLERKIVTAAEAETASVLVELGVGTGGTTRSLLKAMQPKARLLAIERTSEFVDMLQHTIDPRLEVVHGCASSIKAEMNERGYLNADAVVSGIPFSTLPKDLAAEIVRAIHQVLAPGGRFVAYQFTDRVADYMRPVMGTPEVEHELRNVPPVRLFTWRKQGAADPAAAQAVNTSAAGRH